MEIENEEAVTNEKEQETENTKVVEPSSHLNKWCTKMTSKGIKPYRQEAKCL